MRKLKFYLLGLIPGILLVVFILNKKGASCSGYLPNSRVIAESLSKDFTYSDEFSRSMQELKIDEKFLRDSIFTEGKIDFDQSHAQKMPCPDYLLQYPSKNPHTLVTFEKCQEGVNLQTIKKIR